MKKGKICTSLLALVMIFQLTSCGSSAEIADEARTTAAVFYDAEVPGEAAFGTAADYSQYNYKASNSGSSISSTAAADTGTSVVNDLSERKIIKSASLRYETRTYDDFLASLSACIRVHGGYIESQESYGGSPYNTYSTRSAYMTVRIPLDTYDTFMSEAGTLGSITYKSENSTDVTMSYVDTESRIKSLRTEYDALIAILEKADKLEDVLSLQSRISEVTYELETYEAQLRKYDDLISYCTVSIDVTEVEKETPNVREMTFGEKITNGLNETFEEIGRDASDFAVWFVTSLPYFLLWAFFLTVIALLLRLIILRRKKRKQSNRIDQPTTIQNQTTDTGEHETNKPNQTNL